MRMNRLYCIIIFLVCLLQSSVAFAKQNLTFDISGVPKIARENIEERLRVEKTSYGDLSVDDIQDLYNNAPSNIKKAMEPFGYFKATIKSQQLTHRDDQWVAHFAISPGPELLINKVAVTVVGPGRLDTELNKLITDFPLKSGQPLRTDVYDKTKDSLLQTANNEGYLDAILEQKEIRINLQTYRADIILRLNTHERFYFGLVKFSETPFSNQFLSRFVTFHEGEPFSSDKLLQLQEDLSKSHYFDQVVVTPDKTQAINHKVPINVFLNVPKAKQYNIGFGYGTFTGPRVTLGADYRRIGNSGQHFTTQLKVSKILSGLAAKYFIPGHNPMTEQYILGADVQKFNPQNGHSLSTTLSASYDKSINDWKHSISLNYLRESYQVENEPSKVSQLLYPSYTLSRVKVDNVVYPLNGTTFNFNVRGASANILSSTNFVQSEVKGKYIFSPSEVSRVILAGDLGYTVVNDLARLPLTMRYFAGGLGSVRGYAPSSIGPGRYLETASAEYQHKIYGNVSGAIFYDIGNATDHFSASFYRGTGLGIIYDSGFGPIQVYVSRGISKGGKPISLEFSIGSDL